MDPVAIKILYVLLFASLGALEPFQPVFYASEAGLSTRHVGYLAALRPATSFIGQPLLGFMADLTQRHKAILLLAAVSSLVCRLLIWVVVRVGAGPLSSDALFGVLAAVVAVGGFWYAPALSLVDVSILQWLPDSKQYGRIRLWGAVGFGAATGLSGFLATQLAHGEYGICFSLAAAFSFASFPLLGRLEFREVSQEKDVDNEVAEAESDMTARLVRLLLQPRLLIFLILVTLSGFAMGLIDTYLFVWLQQLGGTATCMGLSRAITCFAEVPFFHYADILIRKLGTFGVLIIVELAYIARLLYYANLSDPWWVMPAEALHGLTFAAMWATSSHYAHKVAPRDLDASVQGVTRGANMGLGYGLGAVVGGYMFASVGAVRAFYYGAGVVLVALVLAVGAKVWFGDDEEEGEERDDYERVDTVPDDRGEEGQVEL